MSTTDPPVSHRRHYFAIWGWLCLALLVSMGLGSASHSVNTAMAIFAIAGAKAHLVFYHFMHLRTEARTYQVLVTSTVLLLFALFVGVYPDLVDDYGKPAKAAVQALVDVPVPEPGPGDVAAGAVVYRSYCVGCHREDGRGEQGRLAADLVGDAARLAKSDAELLTSIHLGVRGKIGLMPRWAGMLSAPQERDVLAYLRATFGAPSAGSPR